MLDPLLSSRPDQAGRRVTSEPGAVDRAGGADGRRWATLQRVRPAAQLLLLALYLAVWELAVDVRVIDSIILPAPSKVLAALWIDLRSIAEGQYMLMHLVTTLEEVLLGFVAAIAVGIGLGVAIAEWSFFRVTVYPYVVGFNSTPRVAFAPIFLIWFGFGVWSKVAMVLAIATFPIMVGTIAGLAASDAAMEKLMRALGATHWQMFTKVRVPLALPYLFAGLETGVVLAVIGAVVGEFAGGSAGLGYIITVAQHQLDLPQAFAAVIMLSIAGYLLHRAVVWLQTRVIYWRTPAPGR